MRIHHFGLLVQNIETYLDGSLWRLRSPIVTDPLQLARLCLVGLSDEALPPLVELIEPMGETSPTYQALRKGTRWHHIFFHVDAMRDADDLMSQQRMLPVTPWKPATLFARHAVRFAYTRNRELVEYVADEIIGSD